MPTKKIDGARRNNAVYWVDNHDLIEVMEDFNARKDFDDLSDLDSIAERGVDQPLVVRRAPADSPYEFQLISGERRYRKCRALSAEGNHKAIPVIVKSVDDTTALAMMARENLARKGFNPLEEASIVARFADLGMNNTQIAEELGMTLPWVADRLALSTASDAVRKSTMAKQDARRLPADVACMIARDYAGDPDKQDAMVKRALAAKKKGQKGAPRRVVNEAAGRVSRPGKKVVTSMISEIECKTVDSDDTDLVIKALQYAAGMISAEDFTAALNLSGTVILPVAANLPA